VYHGAPGSVLTVAGTGFVGAYTTFSAFALATVALAEDGEWRRAVANVAVSVGGGLAAAFAGLAIAAGL
jgi:CrcB protein